MSVEQRSGFRVLAAVLGSLWLIGTLVLYWQTGINWTNRATVTWVGVVVVVSVGVLVWTVGILTGDYDRRHQSYIRVMQICGAIALAGLASLFIL